MADYRIYCMDGVGKIHFAEEIEAEDDTVAIGIARASKANAIKCEVWQGKRLVAKLDAQDLAG